MDVCRICGSDQPPTFLSRANLLLGQDHDLVECVQCRVRYFSPLPSVEDLARFYSAQYYDFDRGRQEAKGAAFAKILQRIKPTGHLLDVGCATGFFINGIRQHSEWQVHGIDFGQSAVDFARKELGLDVYQGELHEAGFKDEQFDFLHVNNVIEHVRDPVTVLKACRRIVRHDGKMFLSIPNGHNDSAPLIRFYQEEKRAAYSPSGHIFFIPADCLVNMLTHAGFKIESAHTYNLKRGLRNLGKWPLKRNWKNGYETPTLSASENKTVTTQNAPGPALYYRYANWRDNLIRAPGLQAFGLDYMLLLAPI